MPNTTLIGLLQLITTTNNYHYYLNKCEKQQRHYQNNFKLNFKNINTMTTSLLNVQQTPWQLNEIVYI